MNDTRLNRRQFLAAGAAGLAMASTHARAQGAGDRIGLALIGCGGRGRGLLNELMACCPHDIDVVGLCDVWRPNREEVAGAIHEKTGRKPALFARHEDLLQLAGLDAVVIATPDCWHTPILIDAVRAGKDAYVEKPMATRLQDAVAALDLVTTSDRIVQVGTHRRSEAAYRSAARLVRSGALGKVSKVETAWNRNVECWYRPTDGFRREDLDWEQYRKGMPSIPFDPAHHRRWHLYHDYTNGLVGLLGSHLIDLGHWFLDDPLPESAVSLGGTYVWKRDRQHSDTSETILSYPKGHLITFSSRLGSGPETSHAIFCGSEFSLDTRGMKLEPAANSKPETFTPPAMPTGEIDEPHPRNWIECVKARKQPNCDIHAGYAHSVACIMGFLAAQSGQRQRYDPVARTIRAG